MKAKKILLAMLIVGGVLFTIEAIDNAFQQNDEIVSIPKKKGKIPANG